MMGLFAALAASVAMFNPAPVDQAVSEAAKTGFAGEVLVSDANHLIYDRAVSAPRRPHALGDLWRWASVTKQLTATLVLQQVAEGRLALDDTLAARLPAFKGPTANAVTLRMLLQHTSGLPNPDDTPAASPTAMPSFYLRTAPGAGGAKDALGYCAGKAKAAPGAGFSYNNCDFIVLGAVLEHATGKSFATLLQTKIAEPAGMSSVRMARSRAIPPTTLGVAADGSPEPAFALATFGPSGAAYGSPGDLARFDRALLKGELLPPAQQALAWRGDPKIGYTALGVWGFSAPLRGCVGGVELVDRRGEIGGVEVRNLLAPKLGRALVVFADRNDLDFGEIWQGKGLSYNLASAAFCVTN